MNPDKLYLTHQEVAKEIDEPPSTVKFWVESFSLTVRRTPTGRLRYTRSNLDDLKTIKRLLRDSRLTIDGARAVLRHKPDQAGQKSQMIASLKEVRDELTALRNSVEQIELYLSASETRERLQRDGLL